MSAIKEPQYPAPSDTIFLIRDMMLRHDVLHQHIQFLAIADKEGTHDAKTLKNAVLGLAKSKAELRMIMEAIPKL